jgi:hypothetical protein
MQIIVVVEQNLKLAYDVMAPSFTVIMAALSTVCTRFSLLGKIGSILDIL